MISSSDCCTQVTLPPAVVIGSLVGLGALIGPVQPITAELAVEVSYPEDECAVEATQQVLSSETKIES